MGKDNEMSLHFASISGKKVEADFDGGRLTSDGGVVHLRAVDKSIGLIERLCDCISDDRHQMWIIASVILGVNGSIRSPWAMRMRTIAIVCDLIRR